MLRSYLNGELKRIKLPLGNNTAIKKNLSIHSEFEQPKSGKLIFKATIRRSKKYKELKGDVTRDYLVQWGNLFREK
ncbi:hypothetical protein CUU60_13605 [Paenibacillus polymyxa ATCC 842]|nr:hypothetical protein [Paenibacillus polymyxa]UOD86182.1 hypothetical protein CUU60_13605 [Paenibacillus polymyxa ATCC 842]